MSSFTFYGKVNEFDQANLEARRRRRKRVTIISLSTIVLVALIVAVVLVSLDSNGTSSSFHTGAQSSISTSIKAMCKFTLYPDSCFASLSSATNSSRRLDPEEVFKLSIRVVRDELSKAYNRLSNKEFAELMNDKMSKAVLESCFDLLDLAIDKLSATLFKNDGVTLLETVDDLKTWLSAAGTYQQTCIDGFENATKQVQTEISKSLKNSIEFTSNSLAIITAISNVVNSFRLRRLMGYSDHIYNEVPNWLSAKDRKLLQNSDLKAKANIVVAKDGSGKCKTINEALEKVPEKSNKRFVIYIKKGVYIENVKVEKKKWNVMMIGDGMNATIVSGRLNFVDGTPTFSTATFAAFGKGFIARDMGFKNTAGPSKHQAVALMSSADLSVFYRCSIDAFQDSLYVHAQRQFYRECNIYGTVDFIFGNAAVVLQKCNILPRLPNVGQHNIIAAQGKTDPNQNTGIVIHNCTIRPFENLKSVRTYLGRPWKAYSTTIIMGSMLDSFINPAGWLPWTGTTAPDTIFYSEFQNFGPGSSTNNRVKWKGVKKITSKQASKFTVKSFIEGEKWISEAGVPYKLSL